MILSKVSIGLLRALALAGVAFACVGAADPGALKEPMRGLIDRQGPATAPYAEVVNAFVIKEDWEDLQPERDRWDFSRINGGLEYAAANGLSVRLRVYGGIHAPEWAKHLGENASPIPWNSDGVTVGTIGHFWDPAYGEAYRELQHELAERYDHNPRLLDVVVSRCTTEFAEPYIRQAGDIAANADRLRHTTYSSQADEQCHRDEIEAHKEWTHTRAYLAFNPYQRIDHTTWTVSTRIGFTEQMIDHCRAQLGERCVLGNNSLDPDRPALYQRMYAYIAAKGRPISFQTATAVKICQDRDPCPPDLWNETLDLALAHNANAVELPAGRTGYRSWPLGEMPPDHHGLTYYDTELER